MPEPAPTCPLSFQVMKCVVEVISDTLSKPSPMPVSQECFETLRGGTGQAGGEGLRLLGWKARTGGVASAGAR